MKIGDRVFVNGYVDEIRKDIVIIRNDGGYFGTVPSEIVVGEKMPSEDAPPVEPERKRGKWIGKGSEGFGIFICDNCGKLSMMEYDFCPNCGCRMEKGDK